MNTLAFPSNVSNTPIEVLEAQLPVMYEEKSIIEDSGGPGRMRGGCGQRVILRCTREDRPVTLSLMADRIVHPPLGFEGGCPGRKGFVGSNRPGPINPKGRVVLHEGETVVLELPGGGGLGNPLERNVDLITRDVAGGYVSREQAIKCYGLEFDQATDSLIRK
jgi:N-methylhydantoinase B